MPSETSTRLTTIIAPVIAPVIAPLLAILAILTLLTGCGATGPLPTLPERKLKDGSEKIDRSVDEVLGREGEDEPDEDEDDENAMRRRRQEYQRRQSWADDIR